MYGEEIPYEIIPPENDPDKRKEYWEIGKGLQAVDGLPTSAYLEQVMQETIDGKYDTKEAQLKLKEYYDGISPSDPGYASKEGDEVTARIAEVLESFSFTFRATTIKGIHKYLFKGVNKDYHPGIWRTYNITKGEPILNGRSVQYADYDEIMDNLEYDFAREEQTQSSYNIPFTKDDVKKFSDFISRIWETHGFCEGNTRATAVFAILYLREIGITTNNDYFKEYAAYFRDALVRSNYSSIREGIEADSIYLEKFFENVLLGATHDLDSMDLRCKELFPELSDDEAQDAAEYVPDPEQVSQGSTAGLTAAAENKDKGIDIDM